MRGTQYKKVSGISNVTNASTENAVVIDLGSSKSFVLYFCTKIKGFVAGYVIHHLILVELLPVSESARVQRGYINVIYYLYIYYSRLSALADKRLF